MRKLALLLMALTLALAASAEPAHPQPATLLQPNGESLKIKLVGDEFYHFNTTVDGYTVINNKGSWEYAVPNGDNLVASGMMAHDPAARTAQEIQFLAKIDKGITDRAQLAQGTKLRAQRDLKNINLKSPVIDYSKFRGLIILINYTDRQFGMSNPNAFYNSLCNTPNYTGFYHNNRFQSCTGSVRDYYYDNSMGQFDPEFDIVGPVTVNWQATEGNNNARTIFRNALSQVDSQVDFSQYDADNDGYIDMVFFMVAGYSSSYSGNNGGYLWPHMSYLWGSYDGKQMGRYASSCEIYGWESQGSTMPNAIGTICHEFGHVMGLPDLYDTDYNDGGGQSNDPGDWDIMAGGSHVNYGRTPVGYSLWERWELGFADEPAELTPGTKTLTAINSSNTGYKLSTPNENEFFLFENRQANKWDSALPGHGLVITRVDYSDPSVWDYNTVNCDPSHNYYELVRANGDRVPFPGNTNVTEINSTTNPALITWGGEACQYGLSQITESNRVITFDVVNDVIPSKMVETFESMPASSNAVDQLGNFATWSFTRAKVAANASANGTMACSLTSPSVLSMTSDVAVKAYKLSMKAVNTSTATAKLQLSYSTDEGQEWTAMSSQEIEGGADATISWNFSLNQPVRFRLSETSGSKTKPLIIDDITIHYTDSTAYNLRVAGTQVNGVNMGNLSQINGVEGLVQYLPVSNTLRLKDATITNSNGMGISCSLPQLTINVAGTNTVNSGQNGITLSDSPTITGDGSLSVKSQHNLGISFSNNLLVEGGVKLELDAYNFGIIATGNNTAALTVKGAETVLKARGLNSQPLAGLGNVVLSDGLTFTSPAGAYFDTASHAVVAQDGGSLIGQWIEISKGALVVGDVNGDGVVNSSDVTALYKFILTGDTTQLRNGDVNGDGTVNSGDVTAVYKLILGN